MKEIGIVKSIENNEIEILMVRKSACGENCATCKGGCTPTERAIRVKNSLGARVGDKVAIEMDSKKVIKAAFLVYILPIIMVVFGYAVASLFDVGENLSIAAGLICFALTFVGVRGFDKRHKTEYDINMVEIL